MRPTGFEPATVGFGVQRSTVGATPSSVMIDGGQFPLFFLIKLYKIGKMLINNFHHLIFYSLILHFSSHKSQLPLKSTLIQS